VREEIKCVWPCSSIHLCCGEVHNVLIFILCVTLIFKLILLHDLDTSSNSAASCVYSVDSVT
jgi:hypothetical protein